MIQKAFIEDNQSVRCRLTFTLPEFIWADRVYLVGDFNAWNRTSHPMRQQTDGRWSITIELPAGPAYEFRYLCDGEWLNDSQADAYHESLIGSHNCVVYTDPPATES